MFLTCLPESYQSQVRKGMGEAMSFVFSLSARKREIYLLGEKNPARVEKFHFDMFIFYKITHTKIILLEELS